ncbi:response regulator [Flavobacterium soyangense]|uniref:Response regulator n=1 Tax=Flavobacterium soyangense TaxID=2023265 RepID=A0A930UEZ7_9FLAO|nr:response regulator [Flavobacterium soyangense]MBF2709559.1 response regulator [Flavobacterium soyangense]
MKKNSKVFIVEDDKIASSIINNILKSNNSINKFEFFTNGLLALEKLKTLYAINEKLPDFIILDFNMPIMNGFEFLENIKHLEDINQIPIFMNSASNELAEYRNCLNYENVKGSFSKPFSEETLNAILEYVESN